jgi:CRP/FNR family transcriptional regulator, cyclic AMP receptor protein
MNTTAENRETISRKSYSPKLKDFIADSPFLNELSGEHQQTLIDCAVLQDFAEGERIFNEGDPANRFYLIIDGEVALESCDGENEPVLVQKLGASDVLGWSWLFPPYYWNFNARATKPTRAIFLYGTRLRQICEQDAGLGYQLMKRVAAVVIQRLQAARKDLLEQSCLRQ